ncbi:MAG TPA: DUF3833 family protein [Opitutales bacterium]|nr:DUF3833 family protein [Opitutales bacterium]
MKKILSLLLMATLGLFATSCCKKDSCNQACLTPKLDVREFFNGPLEILGVELTWCGHERAHFQGTATCSWIGNEGTVSQHLTASDGQEINESWTMTLIDDKHFTGKGDTIIGEAKGFQTGNMAYARYEMKLTDKEGKTMTFDMHEHDYLVSNDTVICTIKLKKWGLPMGHMIFVVRKTMASTGMANSDMNPRMSPF